MTHVYHSTGLTHVYHSTGLTHVYHSATILLRMMNALPPDDLMTRTKFFSSEISLDSHTECCSLSAPSLRRRLLTLSLVVVSSLLMS